MSYKSTPMWYIMAKEQHECLLSERLVRVISNRKVYPYVKDTVESLLENGVDVNRPDGTLLPLHCCCMVANTEFLNMMLRKGANVNKIDGYGRAAIHYAAEKDAECVQILIRSGARVNIPDQNEDTALHWAVAKENPECMQVLLENGANVNYLDVNGESPLSWAAFKGKVECIKLLLDYNAMVDTGNSLGMTPLMRCVGFKVIGLNTPENDSSWEMLFRASGQFDIRDEHGLHPAWLQSDRKTKEFIQKVCSSPRKLLELCRFTIRTSMGPRYLPGVVTQLPIPKALGEYLLLRY